MDYNNDKLDSREEHFRIPSHHDSLQLFLRYLAPQNAALAQSKVVLYVHGATFPSALSIAHRFDGRSWRDELCSAGLHVWALDFLGYGNSDRYPGMTGASDKGAPLGRAPDATEQIACAARFITQHHGVPAISIIAHSWGTIASGLFAVRYPQLVNRLVFFGPIAERTLTTEIPTFPAWVPVSIEAQWKRFVEDVPPEQPPVLLQRHFDEWAQLYLQTDPLSKTRTPHAVAIPSGPTADIVDAWHGNLAYNPALIEVPISIIRGEWDSLANNDDAQWLWTALTRVTQKRDVKIGRATHLMHLEESRHSLYQESLALLLQ